ncbi:MAG: sigma factor-like helix-turn-helix DNA-binding protein, partial [bacterium]|nr:sigma factor-like helix-turn-helix DNA-binding protein [bacterium]
KEKYSEVKGRIYFLRLKYPKYTLQEIANEVDRSRERVRQILKQRHLPTKAFKPKHLCLACKKELISKQRKYHGDCFHQLHYVWRQCSNCGMMIERNNTEIKRALKYPNHGDIVFCNKKCQGQYLGKHNGGGRKKLNTLYENRLALVGDITQYQAIRIK